MGQKLYGVCTLYDGQTVILAVRAGSDSEAARKLHAGYRIQMVMDILDANGLNVYHNRTKR